MTTILSFRVQFLVLPFLVQSALYPNHYNFPIWNLGKDLGLEGYMLHIALLYRAICNIQPSFTGLYVTIQPHRGGYMQILEISNLPQYSDQKKKPCIQPCLVVYIYISLYIVDSQNTPIYKLYEKVNILLRCEIYVHATTRKMHVHHIHVYANIAVHRISNIHINIYIDISIISNKFIMGFKI